MKVVPFLIDNLGAQIAGGVQFSAMKSLVSDMQNSDIPGDQKKAKVLEDFKAIGYDLAGWVVNLLIELAVAYVKSSVTKSTG